MRTLSMLVIVPAAALVLTGCDNSGERPQAEAPTPGSIERSSDTPKKAGSDDRYATPRPGKNAIVGTESEIVFRIEPRGDLKINKEYPWSIEFDTVDGVELAATSLKKDAIGLEDEQASIPVGVTAAKPGEHKLTATGNFSVCNPHRCDILRDEPLEFTVVADAPDADPAAEGAGEGAAEPGSTDESEDAKAQ